MRVLLDCLTDEHLSVAAAWEAIDAVVPRAELEAALVNVTALTPPPEVDPGGEWRAGLVERYAVVRRFVALLCWTIEFGASTEAAAVLEAVRRLPDLVEVRATRRVPRGYLDEGVVCLEMVPAGWWRALVLPAERPAGSVHRAAYVMCVLEQLHQRLRRREIFAVASSRWADPRARLLSGPAWEAARGPVLNALGLPAEPDVLLADHARAIDHAWREAASTLGPDTAASIDEEGRLHVSHLDAIPEPPGLVALRERLQAMLPRVGIGELILEVMSWQPRFVEAFTSASAGGESRLADLDLSVAAALTAQALNVGYAPVVSPEVTALSQARISHVDQNYLRLETFAAANAPLIEAQADIALARAWGGGLVAGVDGLRFVVPVRSIDARPNPRYFGRRRGATWLNMVSDQAVGLAGSVVSGTPRDSLHLIDLIYRQEGGRRPEVIVTDTGSYSDIVFGLLRLLGLDYRPQLADLPDARLWRVDSGAD